jgi:hypothetical protein
MAAAGHDRSRFLSIARGDARSIRRLRMRWSDPIAMLIDAGVAYLDGASARAREHLFAATAAFGAADMTLYVAVARRRLGTISDDATDARLAREAEDWMAGEGIRRPDRITRLIAPGFPDRAQSQVAPHATGRP